MPAYSFQQRFVPYIEDGSKRQTIRSRRKHPAKPGDTLYLYYGMRTKYCRKLREEKCISTCPICIGDFGILLLPGFLRSDDIPALKIELSQSPDNVAPCYRPNDKDLNRLAWQDGFRPEGSTRDNPTGAWDIMLQWWRRTHDLPFVGDIIYW